MKWITATELERWSGTHPARTELPELVKDLIRASATDIHKFRFPTGDSAQLPGWDGRLNSLGGFLYVPDGDSVWEMGTPADYQLARAVDMLRGVAMFNGRVVN